MHLPSGKKRFRTNHVVSLVVKAKIRFRFRSGYVLAVCGGGYGPNLSGVDLGKMNLIFFLIKWG